MIPIGSMYGRVSAHKCNSTHSLTIPFIHNLHWNHLDLWPSGQMNLPSGYIVVGALSCRRTTYLSPQIHGCWRTSQAARWPFKPRK
jgi:hypothetical protein